MHWKTGREISEKAAASPKKRTRIAIPELAQNQRAENTTT